MASMRYRVNAARIAFAQGLWTKSKPPKSDANAKEKFRCSLLIPKNHPQLAEIQKILQELAQQAWPGVDKQGKPLWPAIYKMAEMQQKLCLRDGDLKSQYAGFEGNMYISANSEIQPTVYGYDPRAGIVTKETGIVRSGVWVNASLDFYSYDGASKGITAGLRGVQLCPTPAGQSDDSLGGGTAASEDDFETIGVAADADPLVA